MVTADTPNGPGRDSGAPLESGTADCYRCGYDLRGVADDQPCPECGLLAGRSRRATDELHHSRPGWLRRLAWGVRLILLAMIVAAAWPVVAALVLSRADIALAVAGSASWGFTVYYHSLWLGVDLAPLLLLAGLVLLTTPEGYPAADRADAWPRRLLRAWALVPLFALWVLHVATQLQLNTFVRTGRPDFDPSLATFGYAAFLLGTAGLAPLPILLYLQLRSLAKRARSAHLAEHCLIVGMGNALTLLYIPLFAFVQQQGDRGAFGPYWYERSNLFTGLVVTMGVVSFLFGAWNLYLLVRFALAFAAASRKLREGWRVADRSVGTAQP